MWNRTTITEKIKASSDRFGSINPQQLKQLKFACKNSKGSELFFGLFPFFFDPDLQENSDHRQQLAGTILFELNPSCPLELEGVLFAIPKYWNVSIEEIIWYMCNQFGHEVVKSFLESLILDVSDSKLLDSFKTMLFWVRRYKPNGN